MIDFSFTDNQLAVRDMARELAAKVISPSIQKYDREQKFNPDLLPAMAEAFMLNCIEYSLYGFLLGITDKSAGIYYDSWSSNRTGIYPDINSI